VNEANDEGAINSLAAGPGELTLLARFGDNDCQFRKLLR
jgi:hypothetical protein